jgi:hypothetical protein
LILGCVLACQATVPGGDHGPIALDAAPTAQGPNDLLPPPAAPPAPSSPNTFFGAPRCAAATGLQICDSFEAPAVGAPPSPALWSLTLTGPGSQVAVDNSRAARGSQSVHVHAGTQGYAQAIFRTAAGQLSGGGPVFGRAFLFYQSTGPLPQMHWTLIAGSGTLAGASSPTLVRYGGQFTHLMANYYGQDQAIHAADNVNGAWINETKMPANRWACFEWSFDPIADQMHLFVDGAEITKLAISTATVPSSQPPWTIPPIDQVALGWEIYQTDSSQAGYDLWIDEVAIGAQRVGCTR